MPNRRLIKLLEVALISSAVVDVSWAECVRSPVTVNSRYFDGPGSFGELHNTVTLDCLKYVGSIEQSGIEHVLIKDERDKIHTLRVGSYMGPNSGVITSIDGDAIHLKQLILKNGRIGETSVRFAKGK